MKSKIKVGDWVYATKNSFWGLKPMKVKRIFSDYVICCNPDYSTGGFSISELEKESPERKKALLILKNLREAAHQMEKNLFKK